jgi:HAD superfamily hydrolase (TIGR01484 family)
MGIKLVAFDLDGTLAHSKGPISWEMAKALKSLLDAAQVCIISGGTDKQILSQVVGKLPAGANLRNLHLMPTSGARYLKRTLGRWKVVYSKDLTKGHAEKIIDSVYVAADLLGCWPEKSYGLVIENRGSQITFSALGQDAPIELKKAWDPGGEKKEAIRRALSSMLPEFDVRSGGSTSIDITEVGVDKGFGIDELCKRTGIKPKDILFIGDMLEPGGNDYPVISTGVAYQQVNGPEQTLRLIDDLNRSTL